MNDVHHLAGFHPGASDEVVSRCLWVLEAVSTERFTGGSTRI